MNIRKYVKHFAAVLLAAILCLPAQAQRDEEISTLFGSKDGHIDHGGWAGLSFGYTKIKDKDTYLMGARGGWLINHHLTIGLAGTGFISDKVIMQYNDRDVRLGGGYGGLLLEASIAPFFPVHVSVPVVIGAGGVAYTYDRWWDDDDHHDNSSFDSDAFFVVEPGLEIEVNLIKFMRFAVGGSYRYTSQVSMVNSSGSMLRGFNGHCTLKFGWF